MGNEITKQPPIFIVGSSRSGTTLLQMMLNAHPRLAIYGEIHFFDEIGKLFESEGELASAAGLQRFLDERLLLASHVRLLPKLDEVLGRVKEKLAGGAQNNSDLYRCLMDSFAEVEGKPRCGEKTNENIRYVGELKALFPEAKIIHIVRDPRDVVASMMSMPWASNDILANSLRWRAEISHLRSYARDESICEIRYEDLIKDAEAVCRRLCDYLGEPFAEDMLDYHKKSGGYIVNEPWKERTSAKVDGAAMQRWRRDLSAAQVCAIQSLLGPLIPAYGYEELPCGMLRRGLVPATLCVEAVKYLLYKLRQKKQRSQEEEGMVYGDDARLYRLLLKSFSPRK